METCFQAQGANYNNNWNDISSPRYTSQNNKVAVQDAGKDGQEQPQMPPEAEAALAQLKTMPCPMTYFPSNMMNSSNMPGGGWNTGQSAMSGNFSQNPHSSNNAQLHSQNFQLHQELHGAGGFGQPSQQSGFQSGLSNANRQHAMNPQLHAQNMTMHQNLHGVGKPGNQGPQHGKSLQKAGNESGEPNMTQSTMNQMQATKTSPQGQTPQNMANNPHQAGSPGMHSHNMGNNKIMNYQQTPDQNMTQYQGQQHTHQHHHPNAYSAGDSSMGTMQPNYQSSVNQQSTGQPCMGHHYNNPQTMNYAAGHNKTCPHSNSYQNTSVQPSQYSMSHQAMNQYSTAQYSANQRNMPQHNHSHEAMANPSLAQYDANQYATNATYGNETDNKISRSVTQYDTDSYELVPVPPVIPHNDFTYAKPCRQDSSRSVQELLCPQEEPNLATNKRTDGSPDIGIFHGRTQYFLDQPTDMPYPPQDSRISSLSFDTLGEMNRLKTNGLQGIRSSPAFSPKSWVIGPPAKKTKGRCSRNY